MRCRAQAQPATGAPTVRLTRAGRKVSAKWRARTRAGFVELLAGLSRREQAKLYKLLGN